MTLELLQKSLDGAFTVDLWEGFIRITGACNGHGESACFISTLWETIRDSVNSDTKIVLKNILVDVDDYKIHEDRWCFNRMLEHFKGNIVFDECRAVRYDIREKRYCKGCEIKYPYVLPK